MINRVVLIGRLTRDPELRKTAQNNTSVVSFTIAVDDRFKNANGEKSTSFIPCIAWRDVADSVSKFTHKGSLVGVEGRLTQRTYVSKEGKNVSVFEVVCDSVQFLEPKSATPVQNAPIDPVFPEDTVEVPTENKNLNTVDIADDDLPF